MPFILHPITHSFWFCLVAAMIPKAVSNSIKVRKNSEIADITIKLTSIVTDLIDFRIEDIICVNNDSNYDSTNS